MPTPAPRAGGDHFALDETDRARAAYTARRAYAFAIGEEVALARAISADAYLFLYKELVRLCKDRTYCWAGVDWLAARLQTSQGTVKRWLTQLVAAGLIQRKPRPGGDTALTSIAALATYDDQVHTGAPRVGPPVSEAARPAVVPSARPTPVTSPSAALFFAPAERINPESYDGSPLSQHTVKRQNPNLGLVGSGEIHSEQLNPQIEITRTTNSSPVVKRLIAVGVADVNVLQELQAMPLAEIDAICRYVSAQPNSYNPPGLIVALARTGFGPTLLRKQALDLPRRSPAGKRFVRGQSGHAQPAARTARVDAPARTEQLSEWSEVWGVAKQQLAECIPPAEFAAWLETSHLVALRDGQAIVGVPNVFARDTLDIMYRSVIGEVLERMTLPGLAVQVVIDCQ